MNFEEIDKIHKKKIEENEVKKLEEEKRRITSARRKKNLTDMLNKRKAELGVPSMKKALVEGTVSLKPSESQKDALIYDDGSAVVKLEKIIGRP